MAIFKRAAIAFVLVTVMLDMLAMSIIMPVLPRLVLDFNGNDAAATAHWLGVFGTAWALMQFVFSPVQGALSDRFGRRPVILLSNIGLGLDYVLMAVAPSLWVLLIGRILSGITAASISTSFAYMTDATPPERRASAFGLINVAFGLGFILGPAIGGLLGDLGPRLPFWLAAGLSLANAAYGAFVLPESLPPERRAPFRWRHANPMGALRLLASTPPLLGLSASQFLVAVAHASLPGLFVLYATYRFGWTQGQIGLAFAAVGACSAVVGGVLVRPVVRRFGERRALLAGLACGALGLVWLALAPTGTVLLAGIPVLELMSLAGPAGQALMTREVAADEQGALQGAASSLASIGSLVAPGLFTTVFAAAIAPGAAIHLPGAPYLLAAALMGAGLIIAARATSLARGARSTSLEAQ